MENVNKIYNVIGSNDKYKEEQLKLVKSLKLAINENLIKSMVIMTKNRHGYVPTRILLKSNKENPSESIEELAVCLVKTTCAFIVKYQSLLDNRDISSKLMSDIISAVENVIHNNSVDDSVVCNVTANTKIYNFIGSNADFKEEQLDLVKDLELAVNANLVKSMVVMTQNEYGFIPTRILLRSCEENPSQSVEEVASCLAKSTCDFISQYRTVLDNKDIAAKLMSNIITTVETVIHNNGENNE